VVQVVAGLLERLGGDGRQVGVGDFSSASHTSTISAPYRKLRTMVVA
jgi:hypothetical protein